MFRDSNLSSLIVNSVNLLKTTLHFATVSHLGKPRYHLLLLHFAQKFFTLVSGGILYFMRLLRVNIFHLNILHPPSPLGVLILESPHPSGLSVAMLRAMNSIFSSVISDRMLRVIALVTADSVTLQESFHFQS